MFPFPKTFTYLVIWLLFEILTHKTASLRFCAFTYYFCISNSRQPDGTLRQMGSCKKTLFESIIIDTVSTEGWKTLQGKRNICFIFLSQYNKS